MVKKEFSQVNKRPGKALSYCMIFMGILLPFENRIIYILLRRSKYSTEFNLKKQTNSFKSYFVAVYRLNHLETITRLHF